MRVWIQGGSIWIGWGWKKYKIQDWFCAYEPEIYLSVALSVVFAFVMSVIYIEFFK